MKLSVALLGVACAALMSGCSVFNSLNTVKECNYTFAGLEGFSYAGVKLDKLKDPTSLTLTDSINILTALRDKNAKLTFNTLVDIENPHSGTASVEKMDWTLVEAARDLGASPAAAFFTVTLKRTMPGLMTGVILTFVPSMGLFFVADILGGNKIVLVGSLIQEQLMKVHDQPFAAALAVIMMLMMTVMIWLYRRVTGSGEMEGMV